MMFFDPLTTEDEASFLAETLDVEVMLAGNDRGRKPLDNTAGTRRTTVPFACLALPCHAAASTLAAISVVAARDVRRWFLPAVGDTLA